MSHAMGGIVSSFGRTRFYSKNTVPQRQSRVTAPRELDWDERLTGHHERFFLIVARHSASSRGQNRPSPRQKNERVFARGK